MDQISASDAQTLSDPYWRPRLTDRALAVLAAADQTIFGVKEAYYFLMQKVPAENGIEALDALRRVVRVMESISRLSMDQKNILRSNYIPPNSPYFGRTMGAKREPFHLVLLDARRDVWQSNPELASVQDEMDSAYAMRQEAARRQLETDQAAPAARLKAEAEAPGRVLAWHAAGLRIEVAANGRARVFPASIMDARDAAFLVDHNAAVADAIRAEWTE